MGWRMGAPALTQSVQAVRQVGRTYATHAAPALPAAAPYIMANHDRTGES